MWINQGNFERNHPRIISHFWDFSQLVPARVSIPSSWKIHRPNLGAHHVRWKPPTDSLMIYPLSTTTQFSPKNWSSKPYNFECFHEGCWRFHDFSPPPQHRNTRIVQRRGSGACSDEVESCWKLTLLHHLQSSQNICYPTQKGMLSNCELGMGQNPGT